MRLALVILLRIRRRLAGQEGMTLVELMVGLAVVAVLMSIAIPTVSTYIARQQLKAAAQEVVGVFRESREAAMNEGVPRFVVFEPAINSYRVCPYNTVTGDWPATSSCPAVSFGNSVSFTDADATFPALSNQPLAGDTVPENAAYFDTRGRYPFGTGTGASYTLTLRSRGGNTATLTLHAATGQVTGL